MQPMVKDMKPVVKRFLLQRPETVPLNKNNDNEKLLQQTGITERGFSLFRDVIGHLAPALKNVR